MLFDVAIPSVINVSVEGQFLAEFPDCNSEQHQAFLDSLASDLTPCFKMPSEDNVVVVGQQAVRISPVYQISTAFNGYGTNIQYGLWREITTRVSAASEKEALANAYRWVLAARGLNELIQVDVLKDTFAGSVFSGRISKISPSEFYKGEHAKRAEA